MDEEKNLKNQNFGIRIFSLLLFTALLVTFYSLWQQKGPISTVESQLNAIQQNEITKAYYEYTSKEFQASTSLEDFKKFIKNLSPLINNKTSSFKNLDDINQLKVIKAELKDQSGNFLNIQYQMVLQEGDWKILNMKLVPSENSDNAVVENDTLIQPFENFIGLLQEKKIEEGYELTTQDFKEETSLKSFKQFIDLFPIFFTFEKYEVLDIEAEENLAILKAKLSNSQLVSHINFTLKNSANGWLIQGIQMISQDSTPQSTPDFDTTEIKQPILEQLNLIKAKNFKEAYEKYTSSAFKEATNLSTFENFIESYPVFHSNAAAHFPHVNFNNNIAIFNGELTAKNGQKRQVEYSLMKEGNDWKILQIQIFDQKE